MSLNCQIMISGNSWIFGWNSKLMITLPLSDMLLQTLSIQNLVQLSANSFGINGFSLSSGFLNLKITNMNLEHFNFRNLFEILQNILRNRYILECRSKTGFIIFLAPLCISCKLFTGSDNKFLIALLSKNCEKHKMEFGIHCRIQWTAYWLWKYVLLALY